MGKAPGESNSLDQTRADSVTYQLAEDVFLVVAERDVAFLRLAVARFLMAAFFVEAFVTDAFLAGLFAGVLGVSDISRSTVSRKGFGLMSSW